MVLIIDAQKYIIKLHLYLDRMEDTDSTAYKLACCAQ